MTKIREFVLQKIYSFRKPMTNYQIPQNALLKYRWGPGGLGVTRGGRGVSPRHPVCR